ncbi:MAG TPA: serpin family protein [Armatimonadota bacterium]|nr:serpin family protein [Armatimonadota bacterium]
MVRVARLAATFAALTALMLVPACRSGEPGPFPVVAMPGTLLRSAKAFDPAPQATEDDRKALADGNRKFACALYHELAQGEGNVVFSPLSISTAMAMVYAGARGETEKQLADVLHFTLPPRAAPSGFQPDGSGAPAPRAGARSAAPAQRTERHLDR